MEKSLTTFLSLLFCVFLSCSDSTEPENVIDEIPPSVVITSPAPNVTLNSPILIKADATDNVGVDSVSFLIDGVRIGADDSTPYEQYWQVGYWADGGVHTIFAKAYDKVGNIGQSELVSVTIVKEAWFAPILISPLNNTVFRNDNNVTLIWRSMPNAVNYGILIADDPTFLVIKYTLITSDTTLTKASLMKGSYYWKIRGENSQGLWSDYSIAKLFIIDGPLPPPLMQPDNKVIIRYTNKPSFLWTSSQYADKYNFILSNDSTFSNIIHSIIISDTNLISPVLSKGKYFWKVKASNSIGIDGDWSNYRRFYIDGPAIPLLLSPTNNSIIINNLTPLLKWKMVNYTSEYEVEVSKNSYFYIIEYSNILSDTITMTSTLNEDWYYWRVRGQNFVGIWGDWSFISRFHIGEITDSSLIGSYSFNGNADDQSLYGNHGVVYGASLTADRFGNQNSAYLFDGIDDYIAVPNNNNIFSIIGPFTLSAWVKPLNNGVNKIQPIIWKLGHAGTTEDNYGLLYGLEFTNPANKFKVQTEAIGGQDFEVHSSEHLSNSWYHIVGVNDEIDLKIFINGIEEGSIPIGSITPFTGPEALRIGNFLHRGTVIAPGVFEGIIDEIRIYKTALTFQEIQVLYDETRQ